MNNENIAAILKDAINASSTKIQSQSKQTKVFVLPPELLKGLLVKNEIPNKTDNNTTKAETSSSKNNRKTTTNKKQSTENSKSTASPVDQPKPKRTYTRKSTTNKDLTDTKSQKFSKSNLRGVKNVEQNHEQNAALENGETSDTFKSVEKVTIQRMSNRGRKPKTQKEIGSCNEENKEDSHTILNKNQENSTEITHELKVLDNCSKEKCSVEIFDKVEEKSTEINHELPDYSTDEISNNIIEQDNLTNSETIVSSYEEKLCDDTVKVDDKKTKDIDQVLQDPQIGISQSDASQKILNGEISSQEQLNIEKEANVSLSDQIELSNNGETTIIVEETYILEEIIEIEGLDEEQVPEENHKAEKSEENNVEIDKVSSVTNSDLSKPISAPVIMKSEFISETSSANFEPIVQQRRSNTARVYVNKRRSRKKIHKVEIQEKSTPQVNDNSNKIGLINIEPKEISHEGSCGKLQNSLKDHDESGPQIDYNNHENNLTTILNSEIEEKLISDVNCDFGKNDFINSGLSEAHAGDLCDESQNLQKDNNKSEPEIDCAYDGNNLTIISKTEIKEKIIPEKSCDFDQDDFNNSVLKETPVEDSFEESQNSQKDYEKSVLETNGDCDENNLTIIPRPEIEEKIVPEDNCDLGEDNLSDSDLPPAPAENFCEQSKIALDTSEESIAEKESKSNENCLVYIARTEITTKDQCREITYFELEGQSNSEVDSPLIETENPGEVLRSEEVKEESSFKIDSSYDKSRSLKENLNQQKKILPSKENPNQQVTSLQSSEEKTSTEINHKIDDVSLDIIKAETCKINSNEEVKEEEKISLLENNITNDMEITEKKNELPTLTETEVKSLQDSNKNAEEIPSIESVQKTYDTQIALENQTELADITIDDTRSRRKSSSAKNNEDNISKTIKSPYNQMEIKDASIENTQADELAKSSTDSNVKNDNTTAVFVDKSKTINSSNTNIFSNSKDYWESEQNCSIRSLRQLRNRTKVIPQDPENFNKLKNHIEKESLQLQNSGKSDIIVRYDFDSSKRTRSVSLNSTPESPEKMARVAKKLSRKPKSTDNYLEKTSRMIALRRLSAILQNEIKLPPVLENKNRVQSKECLSSETVESEQSEIDSNQIKIEKAIVDKNSESTTNKKDDQMIPSDSNLNGESSFNIGDSLDFSTETAIDPNNLSFKREKVIVVRKIKKGRRSKSSQPKDDLAEPTDVQKSNNKSNEVIDDSKMVDDNVSCDNEVANNIVVLEKLNTAENTKLLEDNVEAKTNERSIDSSNCQENIAVEETLSNTKREKITPIRRGRRRMIAKPNLSKSITTKIAQDDSNANKNSEKEIQNAQDNANINKNSDKEVESSGGLQEHENGIVNNSVTSNSQKLDEIEESNLSETSNINSQVEEALEESSLKIETQKASPVKKGRRGRRSESISSNVTVEDSVTNIEKVEETVSLPNDDLDNKSKSSPVDKPIPDKPVNNASDESISEIKAEKVVPVVRGRRGRRPKSMLPKDDAAVEKNKEDACDYNESNTEVTNVIVTSAEIHEHVDRVSRDLGDKSKTDHEMENSSAHNNSELPPVKKCRRGRRPKSSLINVNTKKTDIEENDKITSVEHNIDLQENEIMLIEEADNNSIAEKSVHSDMKIDITIGGDNLANDSDLNTIDTDDKIKENPGKRSSKLHRRSSKHDKQESLASNTSDTQTSSKDNVEKTKPQSRRGRRSTKIVTKQDIVDSDDEPKNTGKDSSNMSLRKSGRRQKSTVNYRVPDEDVDVYDNEQRVSKVPSENAPKKRRGRPSKQELLMRLNASTEEKSEQKREKSTEIDKTLDSAVSDVDSPVVDVGNTSTRKRRSTKRSTIDEDIIEVETETKKQEDTPYQSQAETLSDTANDTNDSGDSHISDNSEEEEDDEVENYAPRRGKKRKYSFQPQLTFRKRGRPPLKKNVKKNDDDYTPHHSYVPRPTKVKEKSKEPPSKKIVKCGKCEKEVPRNQWYSHNLYSHNDMAWVEGFEKPDFENDSKLLMRVLTGAHKKKNKKGLICEVCREIKKSVVGFISHMTFCGKTEEEIESLLVTCDQCGAKFKPSSMEYHERTHRLEIEGKRKKAKALLEKEIDIFEPRSKRKAAEKAVSKISEFTALVKDDDGCSAAKKLKLSSPHIKKFIQKPLAKKKISSLLIAKWKRELDNNQDAACTMLGCQFTCKSMDEIREHYATCNYTVTENYVCKVCRYQTLSADEIIKHASEKHTPEDLDVNAAISDGEASEDEDYSDYYDEDGSNKSQGLVKKFFYKETSEVENKMFKFIFNNGVCHTLLNKTFIPGFQWTLEFERKHFKFSIFEDLLPSAFTLLEVQDSERYLPELDLSLPVKFMKKDGHLNEPEWRKWSIFEAARVDDCPTMFVGGPVWAMAWAPTPSYLAISDDLPQFLAISSHPKMDIEYSVGESYSGKNIIQIWCVGKLNNRNASESDPVLSYAIAHEGGTVWSLEWCPSGCYQHEDFPDFKNDNNTNRLGLLAAGCSDGCVRIYSMAFPEDLAHTSNENQYPIYKTEPVIQLIISSDMYENNEQTWQIMKLCWSRESNHNVIVAGLSNGYVALWDLTSKSPMLKYKVNNTTFLRPYRQFFAHHHAVTMVALVPQDNKRYLATASLDKLYKFWDLEDISRPKNTYKKSYVTDGAWFNNWCCAVIVHDNALCTNGNNSAVCLPLRNYTYKYYNILPSNSTIYGVSTSDFGNSVATGNVAGELLTIFPHQLMYIRDMEKTIPPKRSTSLVSTTQLVDFDVEQETLNKSPVKKGKKSKTEPYGDPTQFMPSTFKDSKERFGILFNNKINPLQSNSKSVQKYKKKPTLTCEQLEQTPIEQYPLKSINKVAWNPNASSFLWLAAGYQNGFVRLISFRSVASTAEWNRLLQLHTDVLKARMTKMAAEDSC